jgi:hypothetical protein
MFCFGSQLWPVRLKIQNGAQKQKALDILLADAGENFRGFYFLTYLNKIGKFKGKDADKS